MKDKNVIVDRADCILRDDTGIYVLCPQCQEKVGTGKLPSRELVWQCHACGQIVKPPIMVDMSTHDLPHEFEDDDGWHRIGGFKDMDELEEALNCPADAPFFRSEEWLDVSDQAWRIYTYPDESTVTVVYPSQLLVIHDPGFDWVGSNDAHRIKTLEGKEYFIPCGWICISWVPIASKGSR